MTNETEQTSEDKLDQSTMEPCDIIVTTVSEQDVSLKYCNVR